MLLSLFLVLYAASFFLAKEDGVTSIGHFDDNLLLFKLTLLRNCY